MILLKAECQRTLLRSHLPVQIKPRSLTENYTTKGDQTNGKARRFRTSVYAKLIPR